MTPFDEGFVKQCAARGMDPRAVANFANKKAMKKKAAAELLQKKAARQQKILSSMTPYQQGFAVRCLQRGVPSAKVASYCIKRAGAPSFARLPTAQEIADVEDSLYRDVPTDDSGRRDTAKIQEEDAALVAQAAKKQEEQEQKDRYAGFLAEGGEPPASTFGTRPGWYPYAAGAGGALATLVGALVLRRLMKKKNVKKAEIVNLVKRAADLYNIPDVSEDEIEAPAAPASLDDYVFGSALNRARKQKQVESEGYGLSGLGQKKLNAMLAATRAVQAEGEHTRKGKTPSAVEVKIRRKPDGSELLDPFYDEESTWTTIASPKDKSSTDFGGIARAGGKASKRKLNELGTKAREGWYKLNLGGKLHKHLFENKKEYRAAAGGAALTAALLGAYLVAKKRKKSGDKDKKGKKSK